MSAAKWKKLGLVYCPSGETEWLYSHAAVPIADHLYGSVYKIYFSSRDKLNKSYIGYVIIDIYNPETILELSTKPVLSPGGLGEFDDCGAMGTWLTSRGDTKYLYYIGWNLGVTVPFRNSIGLALSQDGESFERYAQGPILDRSLLEPHFCASCCVLPSDELWRMWYLSCTGWEMHLGSPRHNYHIKYAESSDGINWQRDGHVAIDFSNSDEYAISRPSVVHDTDGWKMWYSMRGESYRIGYAESPDGRIWSRLDHYSGIDVSDSGWDSEMIEYPFVFDHEGCRYMLYNGNDYGRSGFGLAVMENP